MKFLIKIFIYIMILALVFPLINPSDKVLAATCKGLTPLSDPVALRMDQGEMVIWENVHPNLLSAKISYEKLLKAKGWKIQYKSVYRPYQYQKHFYEIVNGVSSKCIRSERSKHELGTMVAKPSTKAPHLRGIAFDAIIFDKKGKQLNGLHFVSASLKKIAKQAGLKFISESRDGVHHELITTTVPKVTAKVPSPVQTTYLVKGKITYKSGLDVKNFPYNAAPKIGKVQLKENVEIAAKSGDWYKIKYGKGYGWIKSGTKNLSLIPFMPIISSLKIKYNVNLYDKPTISMKKTRTIVPQTVKVMKKSKNGWHLIHTTLGAKWIYINPKPVKYLQINKEIKLYSKPSVSAKSSGKITPRKVKVFVDRGDGWYQISTSSGPKWIQITAR